MSPVLQRNRTITYDGYIMEAEKSQDLLFASWSPRRAGDGIQPESEGLRTRGADSVNPSLRAGEDEMKCPSSHSEKWGKKGTNSSFPHLLFYSRPLQLGDAHSHSGGPSTLLSPPTQMLISSRNTLTDTPGSNV